MLTKITALIGIVCLFAYLGLAADPPGYCRAQQRYITDKEFLGTTVTIFQRYMNEEWVYPDGRRVKRKDYPGWHKAVDFDLNNPNCCLVLRGETHSVLNRMFGLQKVDVWLNARTSTLPVTPSDSQIRFYFDVCGNFIDSDIGLPDTASLLLPQPILERQMAYDWTQLGVKEITNLYLYGTINTPGNLTSESPDSPSFCNFTT